MILRYGRCMDRVALVRAELDRKTTLARIAGSAPVCRECQFERGGNCGNPALTEASFEPHTGQFDERSNVKLADARSDKGLCGIEGLLFDPKPPSEIRWQQMREVLSDGFGYAFLAIVIVVVLTT